MRTRPPRRGVVGRFRQLADRASTFQKFAAAILAGVALAGLVVTGITRYAPWAWAADVERRQQAIETKLDTLATVVLQSQIADTETRIAALEAKARSRAGLTAAEAEYLRAQRWRLDALTRQLQGISKVTP